jgi:hypothetical protein
MSSENWILKSFRYILLLLRFTGEEGNIDVFGQEHIVLVNEEYQADCLHHGRMLDPSQPLYWVRGRDSLSTTSNSTRGGSLQSRLIVLTRNVDDPPPTAPPVSSRLHSQPVVPHSTQRKSPDHIHPERPRVQRDKSSLDKIIEDAKRLVITPVSRAKNLPLTTEQPLLDTENSDDGNDSSSEELPSKRPRTGSPAKPAPSQANFQCMSKNDRADMDLNPNKRTIEIV